MMKKEENASSETRNSLKKASLLKRIGSICSRSKNKGHENGGASMPSSLLKQEENETCLFDDNDDGDDDSCFWLSSSTSTSSFFDEEWMISILDGDEEQEVGSWVMEFEKDMRFLVDLDMDQWDYCCVPSSFPSPSFNTTSTDSTTTTCTGTNREAELVSAFHLPSDVPFSDMEHLKVAYYGDESPLLWPFEGWNNPEETWSFFIMSPRKEHIAKAEHQEHTGVVSRRKKISIHRKELDPQQKGDVKATFMGPSRLIKSSLSSSKNSKALMRVVPSEMMNMDHGDDKSIEMLVGLEEFDGNEGMDSSSKENLNLVNGGVGDYIFSLVD